MTHSIPMAIPAEATAKLHQEGRLSQTCNRCGREEGAGSHCSWCVRAMGPADWHPNRDLAAHQGLMPTVAPVDPPREYRRVHSWPQTWGPYPYQKAPRTRQTPLKRASPSVPEVLAHSPSNAGFRAPSAGEQKTA